MKPEKYEIADHGQSMIRVGTKKTSIVISQLWPQITSAMFQRNPSTGCWDMSGHRRGLALKLAINKHKPGWGTPPVDEEEDVRAAATTAVSSGIRQATKDARILSAWAEA